MMSFSSTIVAYSGLRYAPSWRSNIWSTAWNRCSMFECRRSRPCRYQKLIHVPTVCMPQTSFEWSWLKCFCSSTGINFQTLKQNSALAPTAHHFPKNYTQVTKLCSCRSNIKHILIYIYICKYVNIIKYLLWAVFWCPWHIMNHDISWPSWSLKPSCLLWDQIVLGRRVWKNSPYLHSNWLPVEDFGLILLRCRRVWFFNPWPTLSVVVTWHEYTVEL